MKARTPELWALQLEPGWYPCESGACRTNNPARAMAWGSREEAAEARGHFARCEDTEPVRLSDADARRWRPEEYWLALEVEGVRA